MLQRETRSSKRVSAIVRPPSSSIQTAF